MKTIDSREKLFSSLRHKSKHFKSSNIQIFIKTFPSNSILWLCNTLQNFKNTQPGPHILSLILSSLKSPCAWHAVVKMVSPSLTRLQPFTLLYLAAHLSFLSGISFQLTSQESSCVTHNSRIILFRPQVEQCTLF